MKTLILKFANFLSIFWRLLPKYIRLNLITGLMILDSRDKDTKRGLKQLLLIKDKLEWILNERAMTYGNGEHPKHKLIRYHYFFSDRIKNGQNVLDIGCGYGAVARTIAKVHKKSKVIGIDIDQDKIVQSQQFKNPKNLKFYKFDATQNVPKGSWDVIILSNVLEHITNRVEFLKKIHLTTKCKHFLIRVPNFERDWQMPMRKLLKINYYSDDDHKIEHTVDEFIFEMTKAELKINELKTLWGEIWADCMIDK